MLDARALVLVAAALTLPACSSDPASSTASSSTATSTTTTTTSSASGSGGAGGGGASSSSSASTGAGGTAEQAVLYIGNSYTYVNDLPGMVQGLASSSGLPPLLTPTSITPGGTTFQDHWLDPAVQEAFAGGAYDLVVLQGQSVEPVADPAGFDSYGALLANAASAAGAGVVLYQTWARKEGSDVYAQSWSGGNPSAMQDGLTAAYATLADETGAAVAPVGEAFRVALATHPEIELFSADGSHPSLEGTYLASCVFYHVLTGSPLPASASLPAGVDATEAAALFEAAETALGN